MFETLFLNEGPPTLSKPPTQPDQATRRFDLSLAEPRPIPLREVCKWDIAWQRMLFRTLLPVSLLRDLRLDPITLTDPSGRPVAHLITGEDGATVRLEIYASADNADAAIEMELSDTPYGQLEFLWLALQDTRSPRFDIDFLPDGQLTMRGTLRRNLLAEAAALEAGLAPGQICRGFGSTRRMVERLEAFMLSLNQREVVAQPLYYHAAVLFERCGFTYVHGQGLMERVHAGFGPNGDLRNRLDAGTPFRSPTLGDSIRGRSWAIHDGILKEEWSRLRMIRRLGATSSVDTCAGVPW